jgi:hypothetical protein
MLGARSALLLATVFALACSPGIAQLNARPTKHYQQPTTFTGRVSRMQTLSSETLLEIADAHEHRILVRVTTPVDVGVDDWVAVSGILVPETRVADRVLYDVVHADAVTKTRAPWFRDLF